MKQLLLPPNPNPTPTQAQTPNQPSSLPSTFVKVIDPIPPLSLQTRQYLMCFLTHL